MIYSLQSRNSENQRQNKNPHHKKTVYVGFFVIMVMGIDLFLNIFAPILVIVWMMHVYHCIRIQVFQRTQANEEVPK